MKKFFRTIHLYLSLAAGVFIIIACVTGCILVFEEEIEHALHTERFEVIPQTKKLPLNTLVSSIAKTNDRKVTSIKIYAEADRTLEVDISVEPKGKSKERQTLTAYVNPYSGNVVDIYNKRESFLHQVEMMHRFLLSKKGSVGQYVMDYSALFFLLILITGIILWWPKNRSLLKQRLKIKFAAGTKRFTHDLHVVTGFYTSIFLIITVVTGLIMGLGWMNKGLFLITKSKSESPRPPLSNYTNEAIIISFDVIEKISQSNFKDYQFINIRMPKDSVDVINLSVLPKNAYVNQANNYYLDQYNGNIIGNLAFADKNLGQRVRSYVKPLHTGELFGYPSKIFGFLITLITISIAVTGVMMWLNRNKKNKTKAFEKKYPLREKTPILQNQSATTHF